MQLPFGEWLPDQPDHLNPGATVAANVYHAQSSYKTIQSLVPYSGTSTVTQNAKGARNFRNNENIVFTFAGTADTIYQLSGGTFTNKGAGGLFSRSDTHDYTDSGKVRQTTHRGCIRF